MPAHERPATARLDAYLARILLAAVKASGGELHIPCSLIDSVDHKEHLTKDYDSSKNELVLRAATRFLEAWEVQPEAALWIATDRPAQAAAEAQRSRIPTDAELASAEAALKRQPMRRSVSPVPVSEA